MVHRVTEGVRSDGKLFEGPEHWVYQLNQLCEYKCEHAAFNNTNSLMLVEVDPWLPRPAGIRISDSLYLYRRNHGHHTYNARQVSPGVFYSLTDVEELRKIGVVYDAIPRELVRTTRSRWAAARATLLPGGA